MCPEEKDKILVGESKLSETPKKPQYPVTKTKFVYDDAGNSQHEINKKLWEAFQNQIVTSGTTTIGSDGYWYVDGVKTDIRAIGVPGRDGKDGKDGRDADIWTIGEDDFWYVNGRKTIFKSRGEDGKAPLLRISTDGQSLEISSDGGQTWLPFEKNFNRLRVLGYVDSVQLLPRNANIGDIYGVWNPDVYSGRVDEEGHLIQGAYDLYVNTVRDWVDDYHITKVYDYDTELPSSATNGTTVLVPVDYLTLDKTKIDGYKVYRFSLDRNGWVLILDTAEIYASKDDIINYGDNVFALVQGEEEHTYELYRRDVGWVYFGTNASITYVLVQDVNEGTETNILSGKAVTDAYGRYVESPEFLRAYLDDEDKILWGIKTDGTIYFGAGVPPQVKDYIEEKIADLSLDEYENIVAFLDDLEKGDKTLQDLLDEKVDKEEGKSLIDEEYAEGVHYIENPEFVEVKLDQDDRILEATMLDGTKLLPAGYKVGGNVVKTISNPEYLAAWIDGDNHILFALKADGDVIFGCGVPSQIKEHVSELVEMFHYEDNPEFIDVKLDSEGKILEGTRINGAKYLGSLDINGITYSVVSNPEWLKAVVDSENKIICGIKVDGKTYIGDADFLDKNIDWDTLSSIIAVENPEFIDVETDSEGKILSSRDNDGVKKEYVGFETPKLSIDGHTIENIEDLEGRSEITTDSEGKIISYRDADGVKHENVGIKSSVIESDIIKASSFNLPEDSIKQVKDLIDQIGIEQSKNKHLPKFGYVNIKEETFYLTADSRWSTKDDVVCIQMLDDTVENAAHRLTLSYYYIKSTLTPIAGGGYDKTSVNENSIKLDLYAGKLVSKVDEKYYVKSTLVDGQVVPESIEVTQIKDVPPYKAWEVNKDIEHYCVADIDFGTFYNAQDVCVGIKYQGSGSTAFRKRGFRITFYKDNKYKKKDKIKIGEMVRLSGYNLKSFGKDPSCIKDPMLSNIFIEIWNTREKDSYPWNQDSVPYNFATGMIKSFPIETDFGGEFFGLQNFCIKKDANNYMLDDDDDASGIFVSGDRQSPDIYNWLYPTAYCYSDELGVDGRELAYPGLGEDSVSVETANALNSFFEKTKSFITGYANYKDSNDVIYNTKDVKNLTIDDDYSTGTVSVGGQDIAVTGNLEFDVKELEEHIDLANWIDYWIGIQVFAMWDNVCNNVIIHSRADKNKFYLYFYDLDSALEPSVSIDMVDLTSYGGIIVDMSFWKKFVSVYRDSIINRYFYLRQNVLSETNIEDIYNYYISDIPQNVIEQDSLKWGTSGPSYFITTIFNKIKQRLSILDSSNFFL